MTGQGENAQRFADLRPETRKFIAGLDDTRLSALDNMLKTFVMFSNWCRVTKWIFLAFLFVLFTLSQTFDAIKNLFSLKH